MKNLSGKTLFKTGATRGIGFEIAKKAKNEFVCIIDDDTIPGSMWIENCFSEFNKKEGLYGTCGYIFNSSKRLSN